MFLIDDRQRVRVDLKFRELQHRNFKKHIFFFEESFNNNEKQSNDKANRLSFRKKAKQIKNPEVSSWADIHVTYT